MSTATEIEKAVLTLPSYEVKEFASWWEIFRFGKIDEREKKRLAAIAKSLSCVAGAGSNNFEAFVAEVG